MKRIINLILPLGSSRRELVKKISKRKIKGTQTKSTMGYQEWLVRCEPGLFANTVQELKKQKIRPLISIVIPCYNTPEKYLVPLLTSIQAQQYKNWQLCLADGSTDVARANAIELAAKQDKRIEYKRLVENQGIVGNTNEAITLAKGEFIAFMDHDDVLSEYALAEVVIALNRDKSIDLFYSDEDKLSENGKTRIPFFFKPEWSPALLLGVNYINHFTVARKSIVDKIGGLRPGFDGSQDYDFLLRFTEQTDKIKRVPKILYHWRMAEGSTAADMSAKDYTDSAGRRALADAVKRRKLKADVLEIKERPTNYRLQYTLPKVQPKISIIIPFKDKVELLRQCVGSILDKTTYASYELVLVSNNSTETKTHDYLQELQKNKRCKVYTWNHPFNFSKINNYGRKQATGEYLVLLNNDTEVISANWLEELIGVASQKGTGAVGPLLYYPNKTIQHAGVILGMKTMAGHVFRLRAPGDWTDFGLPSWPRNYLAVTAACLAIKASTYDEVGGLDEIFTVAGNDVALGISLHEKGYRNVYWPFAELLHYENVSVGTYDNGIQLDYDHSLDYYRPYLNWHDPYFNPNLDLMNEQIGLRSKYE